MPTRIQCSACALIERLSAALGNTTHHGCNRYYAKSLDDLSTLPDPTAKSAEVTLADIEAAAVRIAGAVRRTPTLELVGMKEPIAGLRSLWLKLELLQVTGSFKARGAISKPLAAATTTSSSPSIAAARTPLAIIFAVSVVAAGPSTANPSSSRGVRRQTSTQEPMSAQPMSQGAIAARVVCSITAMSSGSLGAAA